MAGRILGLETEYAITALDPDGCSLNRSRTVWRLIARARELLPHLPDLYSNGMFLQNASRLYIDTGLHPELATPECANPVDLVRYVLAGERLLETVVRDIEETEDRIGEMVLLKTNVDYYTRATWGCHESYLHRVGGSCLSPELIPHLVTRIIYTGAGGFDPASAGLTFTLSPRSTRLTRTIADSSTGARSIFHTKDESLARKGEGYHRLHVISGGSLCSETAMFLKAATTCLIVALVEAGQRPGEQVALRAPLAALHTIASDPGCRAEVRTLRGMRSAKEIQRHYLTRVEASLDAAWMPEWAEEACRLWRSVLDRLDESPRTLEGTLDWAIKHSLYGDRLRAHGTSWEEVARWTNAFQRIETALRTTEVDGERVSLSRFPDHWAELTDHDEERVWRILRSRGLGWDDIPGLVALRREMLEIDVRFGQIGEKGIFRSLDRARVLDHHVAGVDDIEAATVEGPSGTRAAIRSACVRRHTPGDERYVCEWQRVVDLVEMKQAELHDPFCAEEKWVACSERDAEALATYSPAIFERAGLGGSGRPGRTRLRLAPEELIDLARRRAVGG